jgi:diketogulonate reductase-like aldo/keto reductase
MDKASIPACKLNNGNEFPMFGLGTWAIHDSEVIKNAIQMGYTMIDTASCYKNEEVVGQAVKDSGMARD